MSIILRMINAYAYSTTGPQISEVGLLVSNLGRAECFASLMCIMLQSVQRPTVPCSIKNPFCSGTLSTDQFENADKVTTLESIVTNVDLMPDQSRKWWANNWFNVLRLLF